MCFFSQLSKPVKEIEKKFNARFVNPEDYKSGFFNGFSYPATPVITNENPEVIQLFNWGLIPFWAKDDSIRKYTLNARIETIKEKPSFKNSVRNRCLVIIDSFFEWQWLDEKGKEKIKYRLHLPQNELFALAGLWSEWTDKKTGAKMNTYTILTTEANELMSKIHNSKKRMPLIVDNENEWLHGAELIMGNEKLIAEETL